MGRQVPAIILSAKLSEIAAPGGVSVTKPVEAAALSQLVHRLLGDSEFATEAIVAAQPAKRGAGAIFVVDDDRQTREATAVMLTGAGYPVQTYASPQAFMEIPSERGQGLGVPPTAGKRPRRRPAVILNDARVCVHSDRPTPRPYYVVSEFIAGMACGP